MPSSGVVPLRPTARWSGEGCAQMSPGRGRGGCPVAGAPRGQGWRLVLLGWLEAGGGSPAGQSAPLQGEKRKDRRFLRHHERNRAGHGRGAADREPQTGSCRRLYAGGLAGRGALPSHSACARHWAWLFGSLGTHGLAWCSPGIASWPVVPAPRSCTWGKEQLTCSGLSAPASWFGIDLSSSTKELWATSTSTSVDKPGAGPTRLRQTATHLDARYEAPRAGHRMASCV